MSNMNINNISNINNNLSPITTKDNDTITNSDYIYNNEDPVWFIINKNKSSQVNMNSKKTFKTNDHHPAKRWGHSSVISNKQMIIFGGRHSHRSLVNIYCLDLDTLLWSKIEPIGQTPPARDSHSALLYKNELIIFGGSGSGKKLNDLWIFNIDTKK